MRAVRELTVRTAREMACLYREMSMAAADLSAYLDEVAARGGAGDVVIELPPGEFAERGERLRAAVQQLGAVATQAINERAHRHDAGGDVEAATRRAR